MSSSTPDTKPATDANSRPARNRRWRARLAPVLLLMVGVLAWLGYEYTHQAPAERQPADTLALDAAGGWWNVVGDRYLELAWEGRRASLWDYSTSEQGVESTGTWSTTDTTVSVTVSGPAGSLTQELELIGNDAEVFLAPKPVKTAKLLESWVADHGDEEEESSPPSSMSRETSWHPHQHARPRHVRTHHPPLGKV